MSILPLIYNEINKNHEYFSIKNDFNIDGYKRFSELAIFFELTNNAYSFETGNKNEILKDYMILQIESLSSNTILKNVYNAYLIIAPYLSIRKHKVIAELENCLDVITKYELFPPEVPPHRAMEWDYMLYKLGKQEKVKLPYASILKKDFHQQFFDREIAYAVTHALFYLTDFGFSNEKPEIKNLEKLKFQLECLIAKFYEENDVDVLLELGINYFSLMSYVKINYDVLEIIDHCLKKASFVEFNWNEKTIGKKYHSFLVLGILSALLQSLLINPKINIEEKRKLKTATNKTLFDNPGDLNVKPESEDRIHSNSIISAWQILKKLKAKNFDSDSYKNYVEKFGKNLFLEESILSYMEILINRNELEILWVNEFKELNATQKDQKRLKVEFNVKTENDIKCILTYGKEF